MANHGTRRGYEECPVPKCERCKAWARERQARRRERREREEWANRPAEPVWDDPDVKALYEARKAEVKPAKNEVTREHGTTACYLKSKCRCDLCRAAIAAYHRERRARLKNEARFLRPEEDETLNHGSLATYRDRFCRCDKCKLANAENTRAYRDRVKARKAQGVH